MRRMWLLLLSALLVTSCAGGQPQGGRDAGGAADLDFTAATVDGGQIDAASLDGRDVLLWFWAPW